MRTNSSREIQFNWAMLVITLLIAMSTIISNIYFHKSEQNIQREHELLKARKDALILALRVIDNVYLNTSFTDSPKTMGRDWDIKMAHDAINGMLIYCKKPKSVLDAFNAAIGLGENNSGYSAANVNKFRAEVARELNISGVRFFDDEFAWVASLPGAKTQLLRDSVQVKNHE